MRPTARKSGVALVALGLTLVVTVGASARPEAATIQLRTVMTAAQEVPAPSGDVGAARGTFTATVNRSDTGASISWQLTFGGLTGPAGAAHIHQAATGVAGPVVVPLCGPCQSPLSGTGNLTEAVVDAIESGNAYVNVHTAANGPGEIRGQLGVTAAITTTLNSRQERPKPKGNVRRATGSLHRDGDEVRDERHHRVASRVLESDRPGRRGAHSHRPERKGRPGGGIALWPVSTWRTWHCRPDGSSAEGAGDGTCIREHPHAA